MAAFKNHTFIVCPCEHSTEFSVQCGCGMRDSVHASMALAVERAGTLNRMPELARMNAPKPEPVL